MEKLKNVAGWIAGAVLLLLVVYNFSSGWLINPPKPKLLKENGELWVADPANPFLHYLFGAETLRKARQNTATGEYEFQKNGEWVVLKN